MCIKVSSVEGLPSDLECLPRLRTGTDSGVTGLVKHSSVFQGEEQEHSGNLGSTGTLARSLSFCPPSEEYRDGEVVFP